MDLSFSRWPGAPGGFLVKTISINPTKRVVVAVGIPVAACLRRVAVLPLCVSVSPNAGMPRNPENRRPSIDLRMLDSMQVPKPV